MYNSTRPEIRKDNYQKHKWKIIHLRIWHTWTKWRRQLSRLTLRIVYCCFCNANVNNNSKRVCTWPLALVEDLNWSAHLVIYLQLKWSRTKYHKQDWKKIVVCAHLLSRENIVSYLATRFAFVVKNTRSSFAKATSGSGVSFESPIGPLLRTFCIHDISLSFSKWNFLSNIMI